MLILMMALTLVISAWDAYVGGRAWHTAKGIAVCAVVMSCCGFIELWAVVVGYAAHNMGYLSQHAFEILMKLVYVTIIIPVLGAGIAITAHSWVVAARSKSLLDVGVAGWNTYAQVSNVISAAENMGPFLKDIGKFFSSDDDDSPSFQGMAVMLVFGIACVAAFGTTYALWRMGVKAEAANAVLARQQA